MQKKIGENKWFFHVDGNEIKSNFLINTIIVILIELQSHLMIPLKKIL